MDIFTMIFDAMGLAKIDIKLAITGVLGIAIIIFAFEYIADVFNMANNKARPAENQKRHEDIEGWGVDDDEGRPGDDN